MKTLYVSDLDGTLLRNDKSVSAYTASTINALIERGVLFTYATARSYHTATEVTKGLFPRVPLILYNGTFVVTPEGEVLLSSTLDKERAKELLDELKIKEISPLVYAFINGEEKFSYSKSNLTRGIKAFLDDHPSDPRCNPTSEGELSQGEIFHITCIDEYDKLEPLYNALAGEYQCVLYKDSYTNEWWLEIMPSEATKARAAEYVADLLGCEKIVFFGDGVNDLSMRGAASELYATENAHPSLKEIADGIVASNEDDGVAKWLLERISDEKQTAQ